MGKEIKLVIRLRSNEIKFFRYKIDLNERRRKSLLLFCAIKKFNVQCLLEKRKRKIKRLKSLTFLGVKNFKKFNQKKKKLVFLFFLLLFDSFVFIFQYPKKKEENIIRKNCLGKMF